MIIARTVISLESPDGTPVALWSYRYEDGPDDGAAAFAMSRCLFLANTELAAHVLCVSVVNSLTAVARWGK